MKIWMTSDAGFEGDFRARCRRLTAGPSAVEADVRDILAAVARDGDAALRAYTARFDGIDLEDPWLPEDAVARARDAVGADVVADLTLARDRIRSFHEHGIERGFELDADGVRLAQRCHPLGRAGVYVPGGRAAYPSTVLMNCVPAGIAGVADVIVATPPSARPGDPALRGISPQVIVAAELAGASRVLCAGGAQAIAALAFGTSSVPAVDKIVGPGNVWVATAKRLVFGHVDIDSVAGPSEVLVLADGSVPAAWTAADLLSQAEHDVEAIAVLVTTDADHARAVRAEVERQLPALPTRAAARASIDAHGLAIVARDLDEAVELANRWAPEHLELHVADAERVAERIVAAGAVFVGGHTPEAVGDYLAGPNHVLPTGGTARFFSPLATQDFMRRSNTLCFSAAALERLGPATARLARLEGFEAHARSVDVRADGGRAGGREPAAS